MVQDKEEWQAFLRVVTNVNCMGCLAKKKVINLKMARKRAEKCR